MNIIYKILSCILFGVLVVGGIFYYFQLKQNRMLEKELNNQIVQLQGTIKEKDNLYSVQALEVDKLKTKNKELKKLIDDRDEEIAGLVEINFKLKNEIIEIRNATQDSIVDESGNERIKVSFEKEQNFLKVSGFTMTAPPEAFINIEFIRNLRLGLYLTRDENKNFRLYLDDTDSDFENVDLNLKIDSSIFEMKWYEKIGINGGLAIGEGIMSFLGVNYQFFENWSVGPNFGMEYDGNRMRKFFGISTNWFPFR